MLMGALCSSLSSSKDYWSNHPRYRHGPDGRPDASCRGPKMGISWGTPICRCVRTENPKIKWTIWGVPPFLETSIWIEFIQFTGLSCFNRLDLMKSKLFRVKMPLPDNTENSADSNKISTTTTSTTPPQQQTTRP